MVQAPDYIDPVRGYRVWRVARQRQADGSRQWRLRSLHSRTFWPIDEPLRAHALQEGTHGTGIYAYQDAGRAEQLRRFAPAFALPIAASGPLELTGDVIEHAHGWRAEYGRPVAPLVLSAPPLLGRRIARELERAYGIPVCVRRWDHTMFICAVAGVFLAAAAYDSTTDIAAECIVTVIGALSVVTIGAICIRGGNALADLL
jgi:hypothetical protein